jgi:hypothetical protein
MHDSTRPFEWERPIHGDGFVWVRQPLMSPTADEQEESVLTVREGALFSRYAPLEAPVSLYRELAAVALNEEGVLAFANRYGRLGEEEGDRVALPREDPWAEPWDVWRKAVAWLREAVRVWDLAREGDRDGLAEAFVWDGGEVFYRLSPSFRADLGLKVPRRMEGAIDEAYRNRMRALIRTHGMTFRPGDLVRPARLWLADHIDTHLVGGVSPNFSWDDRNCRFVIEDRPNNLLGAVYLQFALAVRSDSRSRQCRECGRWFDLLPGSTRSDRLTCSNSCRTKTYRTRQDRARQLHEQGKSFGEIAKELGSKVKTVKTWVTGKSGR